MINKLMGGNAVFRPGDENINRTGRPPGSATSVTLTLTLTLTKTEQRAVVKELARRVKEERDVEATHILGLLMIQEHGVGIPRKAQA